MAPLRRAGQRAQTFSSNGITTSTSGGFLAGQPYCAHDRVATIQDMGVPPEDYCCLNCGEVWEMGSNRNGHRRAGDFS